MHYHRESHLVNKATCGYIQHFDKDGSLNTATLYKNGERLKREEFYTNGVLKNRFTFTNENTLIESFDQFSNLIGFGNYSNNIPNGEAKEFYSNGNLKEREFYKNGVLHGLYQKFKQNGELELSINYIDGVSN